MLDEEVGTQYKDEGLGVHHVEPIDNASRTQRHFDLTVPTTVHHMGIAHADGCGIGKMFFRWPQGKVFLATIDIVAIVSSTPGIHVTQDGYVPRTPGL